MTSICIRSSAHCGCVSAIDELAKAPFGVRDVLGTCWINEGADITAPIQHDLDFHLRSPDE
jgi:hypothetical protein